MLSAPRYGADELQRSVASSSLVPVDFSFHFWFSFWFPELFRAKSGSGIGPIHFLQVLYLYVLLMGWCILLVLIQSVRKRVA